MRKLFGLLVVLFIGGASFPAIAANVSIMAAVDPPEATLEDEVNLTVTVQGALSTSDPVLPSMPAFRVIESGTSTSVQMINGNVSSKKVFSYTLVPQSSGSFTLSSISVFAGGIEYKTEPLNIKISDSPYSHRPLPTVGGTGLPTAPPLDSQPSPQLGDNKSYWIEATVSSDRPYVGEQIIYTFRFYSDGSTGNAELKLPEFQDMSSEDLVPEHNFTKVIEGREYRVYERVLSIIPHHVGETKIAEAQLQVQVPDSSFSNDPFANFGFGRMSMRAKNLKTRSLLLSVRALPDPQPANFTGLVGTFHLQGQLSVPQVKVGDSVTLTLKLEGRGNIKDGDIPPLPEMDGFRAYPDKPALETLRTESGIQGSKTFKIALVPSKPGKFQIAPIVISYFDPASDSYKELSTPAFDLEVTVGLSQEVPNQPSTSSNGPVPPTDMADIHLMPATPFLGISLPDFKKIIIKLGLLPPLIFMMTAWRRRSKKISQTDAGRMGKSFSQLSKSISKTTSSHQVLEAFRRYLGDRLGIFAASVTALDVERLLAEKKVARETIKAVLNFLTHLEGMVYGGMADPDIKSLKKETLDLASKVGKELK